MRESQAKLTHQLSRLTFDDLSVKFVADGKTSFSFHTGSVWFVNSYAASASSLLHALKLTTSWSEPLPVVWMVLVLVMVEGGRGGGRGVRVRRRVPRGRRRRRRMEVVLLLLLLLLLLQLVQPVLVVRVVGGGGRVVHVRDTGVSRARGKRTCVEEKNIKSQQTSQQEMSRHIHFISSHTLSTLSVASSSSFTPFPFSISRYVISLFLSRLFPLFFLLGRDALRKTLSLSSFLS